MGAIHTTIVYIILFISLYFELLLLITYFERRSKIATDSATTGLGGLREWPEVTVIVPCYNEERTAGKTIESLLALDYPTDKLSIVAVDDGSKDNTFATLQQFSDNPRVRIIQKENGGKHTALNMVIEQTTTPFVGCLDADSYVEPSTLKKLVRHFADPTIMAVVPSLKIHNPKSVIQMIQAVEYRFGVFLRKMFAELNALYVTPGPFSIFRRSVFRDIGPYRKAHNTEDLEMALRMQSKHLKIANAHDAHVHTSSPRTLKSLYKQRVRWTSGFLKNALDYRFVFFKREYGNFGLVVMPLACFSIFSIAYISGSIVFDTIKSIAERIIKWQTVGFHFHLPTFDPFFFNTNVLVTAGATAFIAGFFFLFIGSKLSNTKRFLSKELALYLALYHVIVPLWVMKSLWNLVFARETTWR
jgi:biofilm PGA synthesis N-glycosyltransferase PgaC